MKIITEKQFNDFASKFFPSKAIHYDETYAFIQAGSCLGKNLHYECDETSVNLHIEGPEWRPIRDYLNANLNKERLTPSHWGRQNCQWTIDNEIHTAVDVMQAFLDIRSIIEPVIEQFEGKEPKDYSNIRKDVYEIERIVLGSAQNEHVETRVPNKQTKEPDNLLTLMSNAVQNYETETTLVNIEDKPPLFKITPINPQLITIERTIKEIGMTLSKTYNQLASAPVQGVDTAGRRTFKVEFSPLVNPQGFSKVNVSKSLNNNCNLKKFVKECFAYVITPNNTPSTYDTLFWQYLTHDYNIDNIQVEEGPSLMSTFGVLSLIPSFSYKITAGKAYEVGQQPTFCFDYPYAKNNLSPEDIISIFSNDNVEEIHDDEIILNSKVFNNLQTIIGSYKMPNNYHNTCPECAGEKKIRCQSCGGSGREQYQEGYYADGRLKIKTGQCSKCYGRGFFVCNACNETGKIDQGTGLLQIQEITNPKLRFREASVISNPFFSTNFILKTNDIRQLQDRIAQKTVEELQSFVEMQNNLRDELSKACYKYVKKYNAIVNDYNNEMLMLPHTGMHGVKVVMPLNFHHIESLIYSDFYDDLLKTLSPDPDIHDAPQLSSYGIYDIINKIEDLNNPSLYISQKVRKNLNFNFFTVNNVEIIFNDQKETVVDNNHKQLSELVRQIGKNTVNFLYYLNLQKVQNIFKLDKEDERIIGILEKHRIDDTLLKITIPLENEKIFVVYYSYKENSLYYLGELPTISSVVKQLEEEKRIVKEKKLEQERLIEEKRQKTYSQSMDTLLDEDRTTKIGLFPKLFNTKEYKRHKDAEKAIKLMIYVAKADGTLDVDEKEFLTKKITKDLDDGYTERTRQQFLFLLNSDSMPDLTTEDCTFRSRDVAKRVLDNLVKLAKANGTVAKEECSMLKLIASKMELENYLKKLL